MGLVLDADVIIADERGAFDLRAFVERRADQEVAIPAIVAAEILHGLHRADRARYAEREQHLSDVFLAFPIVPYTFETAQIHARLWAELAAGGTMIGYYDVIVAATAIEHGHSVVTFNRRHYSRVSGLEVIVPE